MMTVKSFTYFIAAVAIFLSTHVYGIYNNHFAESFDPSWDFNHRPFLIHAIPKCGTHYIQRIIHLMTPHDIHVKHINSKNYMEVTRAGGVIRSFEPFTQDVNRFIQAAHLSIIAMVRDPRDALISHLFYMEALKDKGRHRDFFNVGPDFDSLSIDDRITLLIQGDDETMSYIDYYLERSGWATKAHSLVVRYEDLVGDDDDSFVKKVKSIRKIANYINLDLSDDHLLFVLDNMYVTRNAVESEGKTYERATSGNWRSFLNPLHKQLLKDKLGDLLIRLGYEEGNDW